jgi:hypothetical protein
VLSSPPMRRAILHYLLNYIGRLFFDNQALFQGKIHTDQKIQGVFQKRQFLDSSQFTKSGKSLQQLEIKQDKTIETHPPIELFIFSSFPLKSVLIPYSFKSTFSR